MGKNMLPLKEIFEWDVPNWSKVLSFWCDFLPPVDSNPKVLALGERNGGLTLWLALKGYRVIYSDIHIPLENAKLLHTRFGVEKQVEYKTIDVFRMPFDNNTFDVVMCKSTLGGLKFNYSDSSSRTLDNQRLACEEIRRVLKKGGIFLGAENTIGSFFHQAYRKYKGKDKGWRFLSKADLFLFSVILQILN